MATDGDDDGFRVAYVCLLMDGDDVFFCMFVMFVNDDIHDEGFTISVFIIVRCSKAGIEKQLLFHIGPYGIGPLLVPT